jgi:hypothetical protein
MFDDFKLSQAIYVLVTSGVADQPAAGAQSADDLAARAGLHPKSLYRLLRALASGALLAQAGLNMVSITPTRGFNQVIEAIPS